MRRTVAVLAAGIGLAALTGCGGGGGQGAAAPTGVTSSAAAATLEGRQAMGACQKYRDALTESPPVNALGALGNAITYADQAATDPTYAKLDTDLHTLHDEVAQVITGPNPNFDTFITGAAGRADVEADCSAL